MRSRTPTRVEVTRDASYFDLALGRLAGVLAAGRLGDDEAGRRWLEQLGTLASSVGDVVFVAIVAAAPRPPAADDDDASPLAVGLAAHRRQRRRRLSIPRGVTRNR